MDLNLRLLRAGAVGDNQAPSAKIIIDTTITDPPSLEAARTLFKRQAVVLADVLFASLPGGTIDALLVEMMARKVSLFTVPHG